MIILEESIYFLLDVIQFDAGQNEKRVACHAEAFKRSVLPAIDLLFGGKTNTYQHLKGKMAKRPVFGMTIYSNYPPIIESLGYCGFDFAFIDAEHCPWEVTALREAILAARFAGISPLVRVTKPDMIEIRKAFEMGAEGVIVPHIRTKEDMELCVRAGKLPPKGRRGFDMTVRSAHYGVGVNSAEYIQHTLDTELIIPMAEDFEFLDNLDY